jgi:hypothetical protein
LIKAINAIVGVSRFLVDETPPMVNDTALTCAASWIDPKWDIIPSILLPVLWFVFIALPFVKLKGKKRVRVMKPTLSEDR